MQTTKNYGFNKPEVTENYSVEQFNENFEIIDTELKAVANKAESSSEHPSDTDNPHEVTAAQVGLGNVPNVATNDQTPTYVVATEDAALSSGEKLSVAFGKIAKAITTLISHLGNTTLHITAAERTTWNGKANASHTQAASTITAGTLGGKVQANATAMATLTSAQVRDIFINSSATEGASSSFPDGTIVFTKE